MAPRLSKIVTRTGDNGTTGLSDGTRLDKDHARIEVIGAIDELNSVIGIIVASNAPDSLSPILLSIQHDLFDIGAELAGPGRTILNAGNIERLETLVNNFNEDLAPLKEFILPGGCLVAAYVHHARTVCRRAERALITLNKHDPVSDILLKYLNRLSDLLFILARVANKQAGKNDVLWQATKKPE